MNYSISKISLFSLVTLTIVLLKQDLRSKSDNYIMSFCDGQISLPISCGGEEYIHGDTLVQYTLNRGGTEDYDGFVSVMMTEPCEPFRGLNPDYWSRVRSVIGDTSAFYQFDYTKNTKQISIQSQKFTWLISEICPQHFLAKYKLKNQ